MAQASTPIPFDAEDPKNPVIVDGEVTWTFGVSKFGVREGTHTFQKFARI